MRQPLDAASMGKIMENLVLQESGAEGYYRKGREEIDFIFRAPTGPLPVEVKYGSIETGGFSRLLKRLGFPQGVVVTKNTYREESAGGAMLAIVPAWLFILFPEKFLGR